MVVELRLSSEEHVSEVAPSESPTRAPRAVHAVAEEATPVIADHPNPRDPPPLVVCDGRPRVRDALSLLRSRGGFRARARRRRGFPRAGYRLLAPDASSAAKTPPAAAVAIEADDASKHQPAVAKELGISVPEFAARGLEPNFPAT